MWHELNMVLPMLLTPTLKRLRQENYYGFEASLYHRIHSNGLEWDPVVAQAFGPSTPGREACRALSSRAAWFIDSRTAMATHLVSTHKTPPKIQNLMWNVLVIDKYTLKTWEITRTKHMYIPLFCSLSFKVKSLKMDTDQAWYGAEARDYHKFKSLSQKNTAEKRDDSVSILYPTMYYSPRKSIWMARGEWRLPFSGFDSSWWLVTIGCHAKCMLTNIINISRKKQFI